MAPVRAHPGLAQRSCVLLLAIAPAPLAAAAAFAPAPVNLLAAVIGLLVLVAGIVGGILHTGLFFVPALVALAVGAVSFGVSSRDPHRASGSRCLVTRPATGWPGWLG